MGIQVHTPWMAVAARGPITPRTAKGSCHGDGRDILLQGFHWHSHAGAAGPAGSARSWYRIVADAAPAIHAAGFSWVWLPPPSDSLAPEGYIPRRWHVLDSAYGSEAELRSAIRALGPVKAMADVVLNHRVGVATPLDDFADPPFPDNRAAIVADDESGVGTGNPDTGERHPAGRDLDHTNPGVRATVKDYLRRLRAVGFRGWRYDLAKGYHGRFVGEYNEASEPELSVGEFFDGDRNQIVGWLRGCRGRSTAFDFPTRYVLYEACQSDDYARLRTVLGRWMAPAGLMGLWPSRAVTFLDNHDTEYRRETEHSYDGKTRHFNGDTVSQGYAYLLTHPGIPCVFWPHYFDWGRPTRHRIDLLIRVRKSARLHARSSVNIHEAGRDLYAATVDERVAMKLGGRDWSPGPGWHLAVDGEKFAVWLRG